jgi:hypothetical protein
MTRAGRIYAFTFLSVAIIRVFSGIGKAPGQVTPLFLLKRGSKMALHSFNTEVAQKVGVNAAVVYENIRFWVEKNRANNKHNHDGYYWTYNSMRAFGLMFPYLSAAQVKLALNKLKDQKFIGVSNYNKAKFDKTSWYCDFDPLDLSKIANGEGKNNQPIPYSKPYTKLHILEDRVDTVSTHDTKTKLNENLNLNLNLNYTANFEVCSEPAEKPPQSSMPESLDARSSAKPKLSTMNSRLAKEATGRA